MLFHIGLYLCCFNSFDYPTCWSRKTTQPVHIYPASLQQACPERWLAYTRQVHFGASRDCSWGWVPLWCLGEPPWLKKHQWLTDVFGRLWQIYHDRRKFRSQISDNMDRWKTETGRVREEKRREEERISKKRKAQKKEDPSAQKGRKVAKHCVFPMICGSGGSKSRLAKAGVWSHVAKWWMKKCTPLWREAHLQVKKLKTSHVLSTFGRWDVEKVQAVVARSTSASKKAKDISRSDHFWKLRCRLLEVEMSKKCTPLWRKAHFEVKSAKTLRGSEHFWTFRCRFAWQAQGIVHVVKSEQNVRGL